MAGFWAIDTCVQLAVRLSQISGACFSPTLPSNRPLRGVRSYENKHFLQISRTTYPDLRTTWISLHILCTLHKKTRTHLHVSTPSLTPHGLHLPFALAPLQLPQRSRTSPMAHRSGSSRGPASPHPFPFQVLSGIHVSYLCERGGNRPSLPTFRLPRGHVCVC